MVLECCMNKLDSFYFIIKVAVLFESQIFYAYNLHFVTFDSQQFFLLAFVKKIMPRKIVQHLISLFSSINLN